MTDNRDFTSHPYLDKGGGGRGGTISFGCGTQETSSSSSIILSFFTEAKELTRSDMAATNAFSYFDPFGLELSKEIALGKFVQMVIQCLDSLSLALHNTGIRLFSTCSPLPRSRPCPRHVEGTLLLMPTAVSHSRTTRLDPFREGVMLLLCNPYICLAFS